MTPPLTKWLVLAINSFVMEVPSLTTNPGGILRPGEDITVVNTEQQYMPLENVYIFTPSCKLRLFSETDQNGSLRYLVENNDGHLLSFNVPSSRIFHQEIELTASRTAQGFTITARNLGQRETVVSVAGRPRKIETGPVIDQIIKEMGRQINLVFARKCILDKEGERTFVPWTGKSSILVTAGDNEIIGSIRDMQIFGRPDGSITFEDYNNRSLIDLQNNIPLAIITRSGAGKIRLTRMGADSADTGIKIENIGPAPATVSIENTSSSRRITRGDLSLIQAVSKEYGFTDRTIFDNTDGDIVLEDGGIYGITERGRRDRNEDAIYGGDGIIAGADGMGGHENGALAAALTLLHVHKKRKAAPLSDIAKTASAFLQREFQQRNKPIKAFSAPGCTLGILRIEEDMAGNPVAIEALTVGDYTAMIVDLTEQKLLYASKCQSFVQERIDEGTMSRAEAMTSHGRNIITNSIMANSVGLALPPVYHQQLIAPGHKILCIAFSDGVGDVMTPEDILDFVLRFGEYTVPAIIEEAKQRQIDSIPSKEGGLGGFWVNIAGARTFIPTETKDNVSAISMVVEPAAPLGPRPAKY